MPGVVENVCHTGYGYIDPYIEKARNAVPLIDKTAHQFEMYIPPVIETADKYVEPAVKYVEPKVDQLKEAVTPYYDRSVEKVGEIRGEVKKNYTRGVEKVEGMKASTKAIVTPRVDKIKAVLTKRSEEIEKIVRVPASQNLQDLKAAKRTVCDRGYVECVRIVDKTNNIIDHWLPAPPSDTVSTQSEDSTSSDSSLVERVATIPCTLKTRLTYMLTAKLKSAYATAQDLKEDFQSGALRVKVLKAIEKPRESLVAKVTGARKKLDMSCAMLVEKYKELSSLSYPELKVRLSDLHFELKVRLSEMSAKSKSMLKVYLDKYQADLKCRLDSMLLSCAPLHQKTKAAACKAASVALAGSEKVFGAERTKIALSKLEENMPLTLKAMMEEAKAKAA